MNTAALASPSKSVAVTVIGLVTVLWGGTCAALGGWLVFAGADWLAHPDKEPGLELIALGGIVPIFIIVFGVTFFLPGLLGVLAGLGVLWRKQWGRILTFVVAILAILLGLLWVSGVQDVFLDVTDLSVGVSHVLYGIIAFVILIRNAGEFFPRYAEQAVTNGSAVGR